MKFAFVLIKATEHWRGDECDVQRSVLSVYESFSEADEEADRLNKNAMEAEENEALNEEVEAIETYFYVAIVNYIKRGEGSKKNEV